MIEYPNFLEQLSGISSGDDKKFSNEVWRDFWICAVSREASILARREVLTGKAKFGIVGDGKEVPQVAMARAFRKGDFKAGYYRDQTFMFAIGACSVEDFFAQLFADQTNDPFSAGRQMNNHYSSPLIDSEGRWLDQTDVYNLSADISCTGGQMARAYGHALATKLFSKNTELEKLPLFNDSGNGITLVSIGDASTSEGTFWETMNAAAVNRVPIGVCVYDDGYGISVPIELQTVKGSISKALEGFLLDENGQGIRIYAIKGWDYPGLVEAFDVACAKMRKTHVPTLFHIQELTQPQGHSTSGSHERYKSPERLKWEQDFDCIALMAEWMIKSGIATQEQIDDIKQKAKEYVRACKKTAWERFTKPVNIARAELLTILQSLTGSGDGISHIIKELQSVSDPLSSELTKLARKARFLLLAAEKSSSALDTWLNKIYSQFDATLHTHLYAEGNQSIFNVPAEPAVYNQDEKINGFQVLNKYFDQLFQNRPEVVAFGEDVGNIGDVNQGMAGLQEKYGVNRIFDSGIREWTIVGQAIGLAMRGFRPIAEIQYLDYILFALSPLADDLATLRYRSNGTQAAPVIIRTRGHRLEGIWHAGSPIGMLLNILKGMHICVPRNMTQAVGMYNTLMAGNDPGLVIECLNGYRLKEACPTNLDTFKVPLGVPEILQEGSDLTLVTYGSCVRIAQEALLLLEPLGISVELIDLQTIMPLDVNHLIGQSLQKTNRILFMDEDVPGGATAHIMQHVLEVQGGYRHLDAQPACLTSAAHRTPFGSDGDYYTKPQAEDVVDAVLKLLQE